METAIKSLTIVHEWIGPKGPISNSRIPNIADFYHRAIGKEVLPQGLDPFYYYLKHNTSVKINLKTPETLVDDEVFLYELEMQYLRDWHSNFFVGKGILENTKVSNKVINGIIAKQGYLMLTTPMESFLDDHMFSLIHRYFDIHKIPLSQIIYINNSPNGKKIYENYCKNYDVEPKINCEYIGMYEKLLILETNQSEILLKNQYIAEEKTKTFLNFNRRYRDQRFWFLMEMFKRNLLDDFYISFDKIQPEGNIQFLEMATQVNERFKIALSEEQLNDLNNKLPLVLDSDNFSVFPMEKAHVDTLQFYQNSLIHVVTETEFFTDVIHVSEKTFKPIMYKQPFIFLGPPKILKFLQSEGYITFSELWDESYDDIENHVERMTVLFDLVERMSKLTDEEKINISHKVKDIVEHNFKTFVTKSEEHINKFRDRYGN